MKQYLLVKDSTRDEDGNTVSCDGIAAPSGFIVPNISLNRDRLGTFIRSLNEGQAEELQLMELIDDFINEEQML